MLYFVHTNSIAACPQTDKQDTFTLLMHTTAVLDFEVNAHEVHLTFHVGNQGGFQLRFRAGYLEFPTIEYKWKA